MNADGTRRSTGRGATALLATLAILAACGSPHASPAIVSTPSSAPTSVATAVPPTAIPPTAPALTAPPAIPTPTPGAAHWVSTGSMREALFGPQAAKLGDGRVLVVGQRRDKDGQITATTAELWDPSTGAWRKADPLDKIRTEFALVSMQDGRALVIGGRNTTDESFSSAWAFDPDTERWSKVGLMATARAAPSVAVLPDGRVLVAGGYFAFKPNWGERFGPMIRLAALRTGPVDPRVPGPLADVDVPPGGRALATAELFDPRTETWSSTGPMRHARAGAPAVTLSDGRVLVVGSTTETGSSPVEVDAGAMSSAEIYDPATERFSLASELPAIDRKGPGWVGRGPLGVGWGEAIAVGQLVTFVGGGAFLVGHTETGPHSRLSSSTSYRFHPVDKTWSEIWQPWVSAFDEDRGRSWTSSGRDLGGAMAVTLGDGRVLLAGGGGTPGWPDGPIVRTARTYDPTADTWSQAPRMPSKTTGATGVLLDDSSVLVIGGRGDGRSAVRFVPGP